MSDTLTTTATLETLASSDERPTAGCTCCKPPETTEADQVAELEARRADLERRLSRLPGA